MLGPCSYYTSVCMELREESTMIPKCLMDSVGVISFPHRNRRDPNVEDNTY